MPKLSLTWRMRLWNALLGAVLLVALVLLAGLRIRAVLYGALDTTLTEQAREIASHPPRPMDGDWHGEPPRDAPPPDGFGRPPGEQLLGGGNVPGGGWRGQPPPGEGRDGEPPPGDGRRGQPPPLRFGAIALLPSRLLRFSERDPQPWSVAGRDAAKGTGHDLRTETVPDGARVRVASLYLPPNDTRPFPLLVQTAGSTEPVEAVLREINTALYAMVLPLAALAATLGAGLTELSLAPVRRLAQAVGQIEPADLSARLVEPGGNDVFDRLVRGLNALLTRLDDAFARQKRFTGAASHELRTPLTVIKGATSLLLENPESLTPLQSRTLARADQSADRASRLIADLLLLARTENAVLPVRVMPVDLPALVREVAGGFSSSPVPVVVDVPEALIVCTDPDLLARLLQNLLTNALRHTAHGQVTVSAHVQNKSLTLTVRDTGEGIAPDVVPRLGEPFYRPDVARARDTGGAGLGLSLCREIAHALGGDLRIESRLGEGTCVRVTVCVSGQ